MATFQKCMDKRENCFAKEGGYCICLRDTNFKGKPCPFYKKAEDMPDYDWYCDRYKAMKIEGGKGYVRVYG